MVIPKIKGALWRVSKGAPVKLLVACAVLVWGLADPQGLIGLWLTPDQQGWLWFQNADYDRASRSFENPRWRGMSLYASQDFTGAAQYFSQYQDAKALLAQGNALAHSREYLAARRVYLDLQRRYPEHPAPPINLPIIQRLIDANRELSESQQAEMGDMNSEQDEGPLSSEGDERVSVLEREQYTAEELTEDPALTQMWLRQVQRNPSEFLSTKFYLQLQRRDSPEP